MFCNVFAPARAGALLVMLRFGLAFVAGWLRAALAALVRPVRTPVGLAAGVAAAALLLAAAPGAVDPAPGGEGAHALATITTGSSGR